MRLFDCTLRDGANVVGNGFDALLTESIIKNLLSCGIEDIEFGNAKGLGAYEMQNAEAPLSDLEYLKLAGAYADKGNLGMFLQAKCADRERVRMAAEHGRHFLRIGIEAGGGEKALPAVAMVKEAGMYCRYSQMKAYICTPEELAEEAAMLEPMAVAVHAMRRVCPSGTDTVVICGLGTIGKEWMRLRLWIQQEQCFRMKRLHMCRRWQNGYPFRWVFMDIITWGCL